MRIRRFWPSVSAGRGASRGASAFPQLRLLTLAETGTHAVTAAAFDACDVGEVSLVPAVLSALGPGMLCLADRGFVGYDLWRAASETGADLLWRLRSNQQLPCREVLPDGSFRSRLYASARDRRRDRNGLDIRVIEYRLEGVPDADPLYRLVSTLGDPVKAPAVELAAFPSSMPSESSAGPCRSRRLFPPRQQGWMLACVLLEILEQPAEQSRGRHNPRVVKRKMSKFPTKERAAPAPKGRMRYQEHIRVVTPPPTPQPSPQSPATPADNKKKQLSKPGPGDEQPFWLGHVRHWKDGLLSRRQYCLDNNLNPRTFNAWAEKLLEKFRKYKVK